MPPHWVKPLQDVQKEPFLQANAHLPYHIPNPHSALCYTWNCFDEPQISSHLAGPAPPPEECTDSRSTHPAPATAAWPGKPPAQWHPYTVQSSICQWNAGGAHQGTSSSASAEPLRTMPCLSSCAVQLRDLACKAVPSSRHSARAMRWECTSRCTGNAPGEATAMAVPCGMRIFGGRQPCCGRDLSALPVQSACALLQPYLACPLPPTALESTGHGAAER